MANLNAAKEAKAAKHLAGLIRTTQYGVTTRKERIDRDIAKGGRLEVVQVFDQAREKAILREMESMRRGKGVPSGNACHPLTIKFNALKQELADRPTCNQYELHPNHTNGDTWFNVLTKTEYEYAKTLESPVARVRCDQCAALMIQGIFCHETGCPNTHSRFDAESGEWVKQRKCGECGCTIDADDLCCNAEIEEDEYAYDFCNDTQIINGEACGWCCDVAYTIQHDDTDSPEDHGITLGSYAS